MRMLNILLSLLILAILVYDQRWSMFNTRSGWSARQFSERISCFLFFNKKTIFQRSVWLTFFLSYKIIKYLALCLCDVTGYVWLVNMNLLHHNAKFSHPCDPNWHSINWQFRPVASHLFWPPSCLQPNPDNREWPQIVWLTIGTSASSNWHWFPFYF